MNICVVSNQVKKTISGIGLFTNNLIKSLVEDGHNVWVVASEDQRPDGVLPYTFISVPKPWFGENQARWISLSWNFARALRSLQKQVCLDVVHFADARESLFYRGPVPAAGNINDTYSAELQPLAYYRKHFSDWKIRWPYYFFVHFSEGIALRRLDAVIANSKFTAKVILDQYHVPPQNLFQCYKSIDPARYDQARLSRSNCGSRAQRVLFVGTNMQRKGLPSLILAAPRILQHVPGVEFWVVGEDTVLPRMRRLCEQQQVLAQFHFTGWKSQEALVKEIYPCVDVFTMPSLTEALGMVFVEAMASGVPVVGTAVGGIPEIIEDQVNGRLVQPDDPQSLADAIIGILSEPVAAERYQQAGFQTVPRFSLEKMMQCMYALYQEITARAAL